MNIALDYDGTFTLDPKRWQQFIDLFVMAEHKVWIITSRSIDIPLEIVPKNIEYVVFCNFRAKKTVADERGISIDVWVDNDPYYITTGFIE